MCLYILSATAAMLLLMLVERCLEPLPPQPSNERPGLLFYWQSMIVQASHNVQRLGIQMLCHMRDANSSYMSYLWPVLYAALSLVGMIIVFTMALLGFQFQIKQLGALFRHQARETIIQRQAEKLRLQSSDPEHAFTFRNHPVPCSNHDLKSKKSLRVSKVSRHDSQDSLATGDSTCSQSDTSLVVPTQADGVCESQEGLHCAQRMLDLYTNTLQVEAAAVTETVALRHEETVLNTNLGEAIKSSLSTNDVNHACNDIPSLEVPMGERQHDEHNNERALRVTPLILSVEGDSVSCSQAADTNCATNVCEATRQSDQEEALVTGALLDESVDFSWSIWMFAFHHYVDLLQSKYDKDFKIVKTGSRGGSPKAVACTI
eukprot:CAMPEP_0114228586 /NCGR_PEP_ID=MMETSP0058-20121206/2428_1 /TAXON_ID=36894 /ORGANISM="Pyramimonas parkeae, CCMP726" /LENGTH=374 /DNA_ID=CAMNT_0001339555 /DNA_START=605 /DNA_END=1729 /DNA_ORIENTATION=+